MTQPGEKVVKQNQDHKHAMGESPNRVANTYLARCRGERVEVYFGPDVAATGYLKEFDLYSFTVGHSPSVDSRELLFFKGPGVWIRKA